MPDKPGEQRLINKIPHRLFSWIFNLDVAYALFYQESPRMAIKEADIELPSPEMCFQAESAEECFIVLKLWRTNMAPQQNLTISSSVNTICSNSPQRYGNVFSSMGVVSMFTIVSGKFLSFPSLRNSF
jgi:hypothetical protein